MEDSYLGMLHDDHYSEYNYYGSQVYLPAASPGPSTVQFVHPYVNRPNTHPYAKLIKLIKLKAAKTRAKIQKLTRTEKGVKVQRNKRQSTIRLSQWKSGIW